jgi:hypothetical protein
LIRHGISPNQIYFLDCCQSNIRPTTIINQDAEKMICMAKGFINQNGELTNRGAIALNEFETYLVKRKRAVTKEVLTPDFKVKIQEYINLWPAITLPSGKAARQGAKNIEKKFVEFFKDYPEYDWNLVLDATDIYIIDFQKKDYKYMINSLYFISKTDNITKDVTSELANKCQLILDNPKELDKLERK